MNNKKRSWFTKKTISNIIVICVGVLLFLALYNFNSVAGFLGGIWAVFSPFVSAIVVAFLLNMPMRFFERTIYKRCKPRAKRVFALITTYLLAFLVVGLLIGMVVPQLAESISNIFNNLETYIGNFNGMVADIGHFLGLEADTIAGFRLHYSELTKFLTAFLSDTGNLSDILFYAGQVGSGIVGMFTALIASVYMLAGRDKLIIQCRRLLYAVVPTRWGDRVMHVGRLSNKIFSGFISGKIVDSAIIGVICFLGLSIMNILSTLLGIPSLYINYSVLISVVVGVTNIIPFFGPFIGAIPCVLILLLTNFWSAVWFTIFIIVLQQVDGNIIGPKILGDSTGLPAMWVLISLIVFGAFFGFTGMLLGVPTTAVLYSLGSDFIETRLHKKGLADEKDLTLFRTQKGVPYARDEGDDGQPPDDGAAGPDGGDAEGDGPPRDAEGGSDIT